MSYASWIFLVLLFIFFIWAMRYYLHKNNIMHALIKKYEHNLHDEQLIDEIYNYCLSDWRLKKILTKYHADKSDIQKLYDKLLIWGNFRKYGRFVPISSFFYTTSLKYLLKHKDADAKKITMKMMNFFHI